MAHYIFNFVGENALGPAGLRQSAAASARAAACGIKSDEPHRTALAPGDLVLIYVAAPAREFIGRAMLASAVHTWTAKEAQMYPGACTGGVLLAQVESWDPPVPVDTVLSRIDPAESAQGDFRAGVVRITASEYEAALAAAAERVSAGG